MPITVLFWNFNPAKGDETRRLPGPKDYGAVVADVALDRGADIVVLAECGVEIGIILAALKAREPAFEAPPTPHPRFKYFTRFPSDRLVPFKSSGRVDVRKLALDPGGSNEILLAAVHAVDAFNNSRDKQWLEIESVREFVEEIEFEAEHKRTILFGDFNMNPYHVGMTDPRRGLGAMMSWGLVAAHSAGDDLDRFYNPMWSLIGRSSNPGTYYWDKNEPENSYWNCIDGVLIRPQLRECFADDAENPAIVASYRRADGEVVVLTRLADKHYHIAFSDHLPLVFRLELPQATTRETGVHHV